VTLRARDLPMCIHGKDFRQRARGHWPGVQHSLGDVRPDSRRPPAAEHRRRRREAFLAAQQARGDLWDVLFDDLLTIDALATMTAPVHVIKGSQTSTVDQAICDVVRRHVPHAQHTLIEDAGT
jgi:pimeloyl-ACP methyl ester carboxylesterase